MSRLQFWVHRGIYSGTLLKNCESSRVDLYYQCCLRSTQTHISSESFWAFSTDTWRPCALQKKREFAPRVIVFQDYGPQDTSHRTKRHFGTRPSTTRTSPNAHCYTRKGILLTTSERSTRNSWTSIRKIPQWIRIKHSFPSMKLRNSSTRTQGWPMITFFMYPVEDWEQELAQRHENPL